MVPIFNRKLVLAVKPRVVELVMAEDGHIVM